MVVVAAIKNSLSKINYMEQFKHLDAKTIELAGITQLL
jgi:hypothetical protein